MPFAWNKILKATWPDQPTRMITDFSCGMLLLMERELLRPGCSSCHPTNRVTALKMPSVWNGWQNKTAELSQRWLCDAPYIWVPWKYLGVPDYAHGYFSQNFQRAFVRMDPVNVAYQPNLKSIALPIPEIIGGSQKNLGHRGSGMVPSERCNRPYI